MMSHLNVLPIYAVSIYVLAIYSLAIYVLAIYFLAMPSAIVSSPATMGVGKRLAPGYI